MDKMGERLRLCMAIYYRYQRSETVDSFASNLWELLTYLDYLASVSDILTALSAHVILTVRSQPPT
jgi:hypothetical protein